MVGGEGHVIVGVFERGLVDDKVMGFVGVTGLNFVGVTGRELVGVVRVIA